MARSLFLVRLRNTCIRLWRSAQTARQIVLYLPPAGHAAIAQRRLDDDTQLVEQRLNLHPGGMARALPQVHGGDTFKRQNQGTQGLKVFIFFQFAASRQIFMDQRDGPAYVANFMRNQRPP